MKKIYLLSLLCCLSFAAFSQITTTFYSSGLAGSYTTGNCDGVTRADDAIISTSPSRGGYAVFDLSSTIPAGATITSVVIGFYVATYGGSGTPSAWNIYGYAGDLATITSPPALYAAMTGGSNISNLVNWLPIPNVSLASTTNAVTFVQNNYASGKISISYTGGGTRIYTISGETGTGGMSTTAANHVPFLTVTYCTAPTGVTALASPNPVCEGRTLSLSTGGTTTPDGSRTYTWIGPGSYTAAIAGPSFTTSVTSTGVYSLTVAHICGATTVSVFTTTPSVTVNPAPPAITGATAICRTGSTAITTTTLANTDGTGAWTSGNTTIATVSSGGLVTAVGAGSTTITYTLPVTGCYTVSPMSVNNAPTTISGPTDVCEGLAITLSNGTTGGTWESGNMTVGTIGTTTGILDGIVAGTSVITYSIPGCNPVNRTITVNATPPPISGGPNVCLGFPAVPAVFSDAMTGGTWSVSNTCAYFSGFGPPGRLYAVAAGIDTVIYTSADGCITTVTVDVQPAIAAITGSPTTICEGQTTTYLDGTPFGNWSTANTLVASVNTGGVVTGVGPGTASITYTVGTCRDTKSVSVTPAPAPIIGPVSVCQGDSFFVSDASSGGVWSSSTTTVATLGSSSGYIKTLTSGLLPITYAYTSGMGCYSILDINVKASPSGVVGQDGPTTFCTGGSVTLDVTNLSTNSYQWYSNSIPMSGQTNYNYFTDSTQVVTVRIINNLGCTTFSAPVVVISGISPTVSYSGSGVFCAGGHSLLKANANGSAGIITYQWMRNGLNITGAITPTYDAYLAGSYSCVVSVSGGSGSCIVPTPYVTLVTNPAPTPPITYSGKQFTTSSNYAGYQWFLNSIGIAGATGSTYIPALNGSYRVMVTDTNGCKGYSTAIVIKSVGVEEVNKANVKIFPNPANSVVNIESSVNVRATITGIDGRMVADVPNAKEVNISNLANGVYILMLFDDSGERLMVERLIKN